MAAHINAILYTNILKYVHFGSLEVVVVRDDRVS